MVWRIFSLSKNIHDKLLSRWHKKYHLPNVYVTSIRRINLTKHDTSSAISNTFLKFSQLTSFVHVKVFLRKRKRPSIVVAIKSTTDLFFSSIRTYAQLEREIIGKCSSRSNLRCTDCIEYRTIQENSFRHRMDTVVVSQIEHLYRTK